ncbi:MAG: substrate-binding domain-containing protein [Chloroflexota bacterium]
MNGFMGMWGKFWGLFGLLLLSLTACRAPVSAPSVLPTPPTTAVLHLGITTSSTTFAGLVTEPFQAERPLIHLEFTPANDAALFAKLQDGTLDAALLHVIPPENEFWFNPVALDGLAIVVHLESNVAELTVEQVQGVFNGRLANWQTVGGQNQPITLVSRESGAGARTLLQQQVLATQPLHINTLIQTSQAMLVETVANDPNSIGYGMMGAMPNTVKMVAINGRLPTPNEVGTQNYPLTTPLYFVTNSPNEPQDELRTLLAWLQSPAGQAIISQRYGRVR